MESCWHPAPIHSPSKKPPPIRKSRFVSTAGSSASGRKPSHKAPRDKMRYSCAATGKWQGCRRSTGRAAFSPSSLPRQADRHGVNEFPFPSLWVGEGESQGILGTSPLSPYPEGQRLLSVLGSLGLHQSPDTGSDLVGSGEAFCFPFGARSVDLRSSLLFNFRLSTIDCPSHFAGAPSFAQFSKGWGF